MAKSYIIDGNSLLFRAFYATYRGSDSEVLKTKDGIPTNALFAFANMINRILGNLKSNDSILVAFDTNKATFRHIENKDYKANRKPCPPLLIEQMPLAREFLKSLNIFTYEKEGFEADDIAGTFAKKAAKEGYDVIIYTSDRDYLQLIDDKITIHILKTGMSNIMVMDEKAMLEEYGIKPLQIIDYKGLRGDASDNLPGIPGIGDKTAIKLIQEYGSFEKIIENAPNLKSKIGENLINFKEQGQLCYHLAKIKLNVSLPFEVKDTIYCGYRFNSINEFCTRYELKQFMNRLPAKLRKEDDDNLNIEFKEVDSIDDIDISNGIGVALDIDDGSYNDGTIYGIAICDDYNNYYIDIDKASNSQKIQNILKDDKILKHCYDFKALKVALKRKNLEINGLGFDLLLSAYLLDSSLQNNLSSILSYFGTNLSSNETTTISLFDNSNAKKAVETAYLCHKLVNKAMTELDKIECLNLYKEVEMPLSNVLAKMEIEGFPLDGAMLLDMGEKYKQILEDTKKNIFKLANEEFNIDSPKQVADILFNKLKLPSKDKKQSTSVDVLKSLIDTHPIISEILTYRKYSKLLSTYVSGLVSHIKEDGKVHAIFNQALTSTGRLSSSEPNLQNISIRDEEGKLIRKAFYYNDNNYWILSLDYSQIELRILASLSKCEKLQKVFISGEDIHSSTAKNIFHVDVVSDEQRRKAKAVNFGIIYGISDWGLSEQIGVSVKESKAIIESFYSSYPEISQYFKNVVEEAYKNRYAKTLLGRRRYLNEIHDSNYQVREFARRAAMNAPIQGTAADLIKIAMVKTDEMLTKKGLKTKLILQIHDELLFKVPSDEKDIVLKEVKNIMENALSLDTKLEVSGGYGRTWYDAK